MTPHPGRSSPAERFNLSIAWPTAVGMTWNAIAMQRRVRLVALVAAMMLVLAACGGAQDAELSTIDDDSSVNERDAAIPDTNGDQAAELSTIDPGEDGDQLPVPPVVMPPAPAADASPAERQRLQELGVPPAALESIKRLGTPDEDLDDASNPANSEPPAEPQPLRQDLDQFPATIPATVPGASDAQDQTNDSFTTPDSADNTQSFAGADAGIEVEAPVEDGTASGVEAPTAAEAEPLEADAAAPQLEAPTCDEADCEDTELSLTADAPDEDESEPSATETPAPERESDCVNRPWDRGCAGPTPDPEDLLAQFDGDDDDPDQSDPDQSDPDQSDPDQSDPDQSDPDQSDPDMSAEGDESQGVDVPQEVIDILLTPADSENPLVDEDSPSLDSPAPDSTSPDAVSDEESDG